MPKKHVVRQGECLTRIAAQYGFADWRKLYHHPSNAALRDRRPNPHAIYPGDELNVPDVSFKQVTVNTGKTYRIVVDRPAVLLNVSVNDLEGKPLKGKSYRFESAAFVFEGKTTGDGRVEMEAPLNIDAGQLVVWMEGPSKGARHVWNVSLGELSPPEKMRGMRQRLCNLGYPAGKGVDEVEDEPLRIALHTFQLDAGLTASGKLDEQTRAKLLAAHSDV